MAFKKYYLDSIEKLGTTVLFLALILSHKLNIEKILSKTVIVTKCKI